jgi:hypothetical protein
MTASTMKYRIPLMLVALLTASSAAAYVYTGGPNIVNMAGSSCRAPTSGGESNLYHDSGSTTVKSAVALQTVLCPIIRRGTSFYGGKRLNGTLPPATNGTELKVNMSLVTVRASDSSTANKLTCFTFGSRLSDQSLYFGVSKALCGSTLGCALSDVSATWTGWNTLRLAPPVDLKLVETVNYGVSCDVPATSTIQYLEGVVTPN